MERLLLVFCIQVSPHGVISILETGTPKVVLVHASTETIALKHDEKSHEHRFIRRALTMTDRVSGPSHVLANGGHNELDRSPVINAIRDRHLDIGQWYLNHETPECEGPTRAMINPYFMPFNFALLMGSGRFTSVAIGCAAYATERREGFRLGRGGKGGRHMT